MSPSEPPALAERFVLESLLGRGAFGEVYRGRDRLTGELVALKRLHGHLTDPVIAERFDREARLLARIESPHVVRYVAHGADADGRAYLVLEWLDGVDLARRQTTEPLSLADAVEVTRQAALGLDALHDAGIVHRDVKPSNFFLVTPRAHSASTPPPVASATSDAETSPATLTALASPSSPPPPATVSPPPLVKLIDLGIARAVTEAALTMEGLRIGTPAYMSPEQARGEDRISPVSDVFSLGVVLYELISGRRAFAGDDPFAVLARVVLEDPPRLRALVSDVPPELDAIVARAMAKSPEQRYSSAREMSLALAGVTNLSGDTPRGREDLPTAQLRSGTTVRFERRIVTAIFAGFASLDDPDEGMHAFARIAAEHGGITHRTLGRRMIAVFGVARSSGDEVVRAARAALAAAEKIPGVRLAISTGRAITGASGLSGEAIDRGVAEIERAHGAVRVDGPSARLLAGHFVIEGDEQDFVLRGERASITAVGARLFGRETPTVGRERELEALEDAFLQSARERRARAAIVRGAPGIGKSRLRFELLRRIAAYEERAEVMIVRGDPMLAEVPLGMLARALRHEALVEQGAGPDAQREAVRRWAVRIGLPHLTSFLGELLRVEFPSEGDPRLAAARGDPSLLRTRLRDTFVAVLRARRGSNPMVVAIDDAHWADAATLEAFAWALDALANDAVFVVAFGRPEMSPHVASMWSIAQPLVLDVMPLSSRACEALVRSVLGARATDAHVQSIVARSMGNPLFVEELLRAANAGEEAELPIAIQAAFQIRLDALPAPAKRGALVGSVLGASVFRDALAAMEPGIDVDQALGSLAQAEVLAERPRSRFGKTREYIFRHALLRDAAYAMLSAEEQTRLHRAAAEWLERAGEEDDAVLAHHLERAGEVARAAERYLAAARRAAREGAYEQCLAHAGRGLAAGGTAEVRAALHAVAAQACHPVGRYAEGIAHAEQGLALTSDAARRLELAAIYGLTVRRKGDVSLARTVMQETLEATRDAPGTPEVVRARIALRLELAWNDVAAGQYGRAIATAQEALRSLPAESPGLEALALSGWHALARAQYGAGELERSLAAYRMCVERANAMGHRWRGEGARNGLAQVLLALGQNEEARRELAGARENARALKLPSTEGYALLYLGVARARLGDRAGALQDEASAARIGAELRAPALESAARALRAWLLLGGEDLAGAEAEANAARALSGAPKGAISLSGATLAAVRLREGKDSEGLAFADEVARELSGARPLEDGDETAMLVLLEALGARGLAERVASARNRVVAEVSARLRSVRDEGARVVMRAHVPEVRVLAGS